MPVNLSPQAHESPTRVVGDRVRVIRDPRARGVGPWLVAAALGLVALAAVLVVLVRSSSANGEADTRARADLGSADPSSAPAARSLAELRKLPLSVRRVAPGPLATESADTVETEPPSHDPNDLASYFQPGDAEPTMAELIEALNDAGIHSGIAAFNPPGTSPPLSGLGVPEDYPLPPGYVRHHQVTDQGEPIEPILMFSPDFEFYDDQGRPIAIPENRVVPPELVPPGMPVHEVIVPKP